MDFYSSSFTLPRTTATITNNNNITNNHNNVLLPFSTPTSSPPSASAVDEPSSTPLVSRIPSCLPSNHHHSPPNSTSPHNTPPVSATSTTFPAVLAPRPRRPALPSPETVSRTCADVMAHHPCLVTSTRSQQGSYTFHLSGGAGQVLAARGRLLRESPFEAERVVRMARTDVLEGGTTVKAGMRRKLDEIASVTRAHLSIVGSEGAIGEVDVVIRGEYEAVEQARVRLLVLFDQLSGLHSDVCEIDYKLHHIISGRKRTVIQSVQEETATNIYFPSALSGGGVLGTRNALLLSKQNTIFITGEYFGVQRAREMLFQVSLHKSKCIISRDTALLPRKLDWMLMEKLEPIKQIMHDNGTFINFPPIGSQISVISVYGDNVVPIERTIRSLMQLACEFYTATIWLLSTSTYLADSETLNQAEVARVLDTIAADTGAEVVFKATNTFEVFGTQAEVTAAVERLLALELVKAYQPEIRFQVELACEHRDFISGKKNGKLNKIMKGSSVKIKFESFNDYNFLIDLSGSAASALAGLSLLEDELPAEISFHIPECYHKRIIGVGGKNIQRIMKKYGVYVKFSNAEEFASLGGYAHNHDNVIARTPAKNGSNLDNLKQSVMELVHPKDKHYLTETLPVPRQSHRTLLGEKSIFLHDIEAKTGVRFYFPSSESGTEAIEVFGPEAQLRLALQMVSVHVGLEAERRLPATEEVVEALGSEAFEHEIVEGARAKWGIRVEVRREGEEVVVRLSARANGDGLRSAKAGLERFLADRKIDLRSPGPLPSIAPVLTGSKFARGRSRTASSSFSLFAPTTPTDPFPPTPATHGHSATDFKPFDHHAAPYASYLPTGRVYSNSFGSGLGAVGAAPGDWHSTVPRQMMDPTESARFQQEQISEQIRRLSARAQSLDLGRSTPGGSSNVVVGLGGTRHRISQSGSLFGGLGIGL